MASTDPDDRVLEMAQLASFCHEVGHLKMSPRTGWFFAGIQHPESVAEHSHRVSIIGTALALMAGADPARTSALCAAHDLPETRTSDIPSVGKHYLEKMPDVKVIHDQVAGLPVRVQEYFVNLVEEYAAQETIEARVARDADKLECLAQAIEYVDRGHPQAQEWVAGSIASIVTSEGRRLADALVREKASSWWMNFVRNYRSTSVHIT